MPSILYVSFLSCCPCIVSTMVCCAAWGCSTRSEKGVRMYGFPADMERRKKWLAQVSRSNLNINKNYNNKKICEVIILKFICTFLHGKLFTRNKEQAKPCKTQGAETHGETLQGVISVTYNCAFNHHVICTVCG